MPCRDRNLGCDLRLTRISEYLALIIVYPRQRAPHNRLIEPSQEKGVVGITLRLLPCLDVGICPDFRRGPGL
jgi:hypothetical protein